MEAAEDHLKIEHDVSLQPFNTMAVDASTKFMVAVDSVLQLKDALAWAEQRELPVLVLGGGSNTIFQSDYPGLVILNRIKGIELLSETEDSVVLKVGAGENWHQLVEYSVKQAWHGLENLALIPGLVGAAPIQNIGAYGVEISQSLQTVDYVDIYSKAEHQLANTDCEFAYRDSIFKRQLLDKVVITAMTVELKKHADLNLSYPALQIYLDQANIKSPQQLDVYNAVCDIRSRKLPSPDVIPNAGSFFKNPLVSDEKFAELKQQFPELVSFQVAGGHKLAAAWLIENAGWKQQVIDGVSVHQDQALVIINPLRLKGETIVNLAQCILSDIKVRYRVVLEIEPRLI